MIGGYSYVQLLVQSIYSYNNEINELIILSLCLSSITNITTVISWFMTKDINSKYDLIQYGIKITFVSDENTEKQLLNILKYRGCTQRLRNKLCLLLGIETSKLQIVCIDMNKDG
eukprot:244844_1